MDGKVEFRRIKTSELVPVKNDRYIDVGLTKVLDKLAFGPALILKGSKGVGKTAAIEQWAAMQKVPFLRYSCHEETSSRDLVGTYVPEGHQKVFFQLGVLTAGIQVANEEACCIVVLEEINTLRPEMQKIINSVADYRQAIEMPKLGTIFRVIPGNKLWLIGTMNPNYAGTYSLNPDMRSRFQFIDVPYMPKDKERELLYNLFPTTPSATERDVVSKLLQFATETRGGTMGYDLSTRDLESFILSLVQLQSLEHTLKLLEGKFEVEHADNVRARVKSVFNVDLNQVKLF